MDVLILCGGMGTRLKDVSGELPKPMVEVCGRPFLELLVDYVRGYGFRRIIFCTGYRGEYIEEYFSGKDSGFVFSRETTPLGTAGAIKNAEGLIEGEDFIVLNGDSFCDVDLAGFSQFHRRKGGICSVVVVKTSDVSDYGSVEFTDDGRITGFFEKKGGKDGYVNAGVYCFRRDVLEEIPQGSACSMEYELLPSILNRGVYGYVCDGSLYDIGTPSRLARARQELYDILTRHRKEE